MAKIRKVRPVLLSAPYADPKSSLEVKLHLRTGYRTCGLVEITLLDCCAKEKGLPLFRFLGGDEIGELKLYASGGDSNGPDAMDGEIARVGHRDWF